MYTKEDVEILKDYCFQLELMLSDPTFIVEENQDVIQDILNNSLQFNANHGEYDKVVFLVNMGANIAYRDHSALACAVRNDKLLVVKFLFEHGGNPYASDSIALYYAARYGYIDIIRYFISQNITFKREHILYAYLNSHLTAFFILYLSQYKCECSQDQVCKCKDMNFMSYASYTTRNQTIESRLFHCILCQFFYSREWYIENENIVNNELWDSNIGLVVMSYCW